MPLFSTTPPDDPRGQSLELKRCPPGASLTGIITTPEVCGCPTHYYGGRTMPHEEVDCEPCSAGIGWLWHGYVAIYKPSEKMHFLFEMTARCVEPLTEYHLANGSLRGCSIVAQRPSGKPNGRVYLKTKSIDLASLYLPDAPNLRQVLAMIWGLPAPNLHIEGSLKNHPRITVSKSGNGKLPPNKPVAVRP